jgi:IS5 family transposase
VVELRYTQRTVWEGWLPEEAAGWWEEWMRKADHLLDDGQLLEAVYEAQGRRHPNSRRRGRKQTPAEVVLRLAVLKHIRNWSFDDTEREVRANVVYRQFTRIGARKVPDAKTIGRQVRALGPEVVKQVHARLVGMARENKAVRGRRMRVDTTVTETNIHYPTDSSLLGDGVRVLVRTMKKVEEIAGRAGTRVRDRMRSATRRVIEIGRASRAKGPVLEERFKKGYRQLLTITRKVVNQAVRFSGEIATGVKRAPDWKKQMVLGVLQKELDGMVGRVRQVIVQTRERVLRGNTRVREKLVSLFEPSTEIIRKGKAGKPTEFGKMVKIQEAENQIITDYEVYETRPSDCDILVAAVEAHHQQFGQAPKLVAGDAGFYSAANERELGQRGVQRVSIPNYATKSEERRRRQKTRWFRRGQKWRTGCEGRISVLKRRHGLNRCRYRGEEGMQRWVGLGVIADTLINLGRVLVANESG